MTASRVLSDTITVSSPWTLTDLELNGSLTLGDFVKTAKFEDRPGIGTTMEVRTCDLTTELTGHTSAFCDLSLPINQLAEDDFTIDSNNYITARLTGDNYMGSCQVNDLLHGSGWKMQGLTSYVEKIGRTGQLGSSKIMNYSVWAKKSSKKKS